MAIINVIMSNVTLYKEASKILLQLQKERGSLKSLVFEKNRGVGHRKKLYALTAQSIKSQAILEEVIEKCDLLHKEPKLSLHLCIVVLYDLLLGKGLQCGGYIKQAISRHKNQIKDAFVELGKRKPTTRQAGRIPRYCRVNLLKSTLSKVLRVLSEEGYVLVTRDEWLCHFASCTVSSEVQHPLIASITDEKSDETKQERRVYKYCRDEHLCDVLLFCTCAPVTSSTLYTNCEIVLQDKASCLPAFILNPSPGSCVIDACASPGNKTTQLASIMLNKGLLYAFDKDISRFSTLKTTVSRHGAICAMPLHYNFLEVNPKDYDQVKYILVDPSCSGSGIVSRLECETEINYKRLCQLSHFQSRMLQHALSFPSVERVVYSTCSVHKEENECVIKQVLRLCSASFDLVEVMPEWKSRGLPFFSQGKLCLRANTDDATNGFFVAMFKRKDVFVHQKSLQKVKLVEFKPEVPLLTDMKSKKSPAKKRKRKIFVPVNHS